MHGHYLDCHLTVPTLERLSVGVMSRLLRRPASGFEGADDYEAMGAPVFAWRDAVARDAHTGATLNGMATVTAWQALGGAGVPTAGPRGAGGSGGRGERSPAGLGGPRSGRPSRWPSGALNRLGIGPIRAGYLRTRAAQGGTRGDGRGRRAA